MRRRIMQCCIFAVILMSATISAATPTVTGVTAKQRYPWNGMVDITCTVSGISGNAGRFEFTVAAVNSGSVHDVSQFWVVKDGTNSTDRTVHANGTYRLVWDSKVDFDNQICSNMVMRVSIERESVQLWANGPYWATTNIGAENPWDSGYYFWWGDTIGYKRENNTWVASDGSSANFSFGSGNTPTYDKDTTTLQSEGWVTSDGVLAPVHDAAHVQWGGSWRIPTKQDLDGLVSNCDWTWTTMNGVNGYVVRGRDGYTSASIFLPAAGRGDGTSLNYAGSLGNYRSSVPSTSNFHACVLTFNSTNHYTSTYYRYFGQPVRPVQSTPADVVFNVNGGSGGTVCVVATFGNDMPPITIPVRDGYTFDGYYAGADGSGTQYYTASGTSAHACDFIATTTLYAKWTIQDTHDKVQLWANGPYWATTNIGAENPWDSGYYFWWGDTMGYKRVNDAWVASDGSSSNFSFETGNTPTYGKDTATLQSEGWLTAEGILVPEHDAAHVQWGGSWRMPTKLELAALVSNCDWTWTTMNGVNGYVVRGRGDYTSACIFLPAADNGKGPSLDSAGSNGYYWSSVPASGSNGAWSLLFFSSYHSTNGNFRYFGQPVRPLQGFTQ